MALVFAFRMDWSRLPWYCFEFISTFQDLNFYVEENLIKNLHVSHTPVARATFLDTCDQMIGGFEVFIICLSLLCIWKGNIKMFYKIFTFD